jgi:hypothetical protein
MLLAMEVTSQMVMSRFSSSLVRQLLKDCVHAWRVVSKGE